MSHGIAADPSWAEIRLAGGTFIVLWWTWIGFAVFYNRYGDVDSVPQRLFVVAATVPCGLAAVAVHDLADGYRLPFTLSLAGARVMLALAHFAIGGKLAWRIGIGYTLSAAGFVLSAFLPNPAWWIVWSAVMAIEAAQLFYGEDRRSHMSGTELRRANRHDLSWLIPADKTYALDAHHLAERFGLFVIILLGEVVASAGQGVLTTPERHTSDWAGLAAGITLTGALWWLYFDSAADLNRRLLELAGGSPAVARGVFAVGHVVPAFALILTAAGMRLLLEGDRSANAYWLVSVGLGIYLLGTRALLASGITRAGRVLRLLLVLATFQLARLHLILEPAAYIWTVAGWVVVCAAVAMVRRPDDTAPEGPGEL